MILVEAPSVTKVLPMEFQEHRRINMSENLNCVNNNNDNKRRPHSGNDRTRVILY